MRRKRIAYVSRLRHMTDGKLKTEYITLTKLTPHPRNVRQGDVGAISQSLTEHGQYRPLVVQRSTGHIVAGNHTYRAAAALGWKQLAVTYLDITDDEALRILLVDNRTNDLAAYDDAALTELLAALAATDQALTGTGFDGDDLDDLLFKTTANAGNLMAGLSAPERRDQWESLDARTMILTFTKDDHKTMSDMMTALRKRLEVESNSALVELLVRNASA